jgi:hypothetical protein
MIWRYGRNEYIVTCKQHYRNNSRGILDYNYGIAAYNAEDNGKG